MAHQAYGRPVSVGTNFLLGKGTCESLLDAFSFPFFRPAFGARTPPLDSPPIPRAWRFLSDAGRTFFPRLT